MSRRRLLQTFGFTFKTLHRRQLHNSATKPPKPTFHVEAGTVTGSSSAKIPSGPSIFAIGEKYFVFSGLFLGCSFAAGYNVAKFKDLKNRHQLRIESRQRVQTTSLCLPESLSEFKDLLLTDDNGKVIQVRPLGPGPMSTIYQKLFMDNKESRWTNMLVASNVLVHIANVASGKELANWGAQVNHLVKEGQWWRIVTSNFLHGGMIHLGLNMWGLYDFGQTMEVADGPKKYLTVYGTSALTAAWMSSLFLKNNRGSIGASGPIFGLFGAEIMSVLRNKELDQESKDLRLKDFGETLLLTLVFGIVFRKKIDNWGHLGGLLGGAATWLLLDAIDG